MFFCTKRIVSSLIYGDDIVLTVIEVAESGYGLLFSLPFFPRQDYKTKSEK